jgi:hypothetical protein
MRLLMLAMSLFLLGCWRDSEAEMQLSASQTLRAIIAWQAHGNENRGTAKPIL